jgi:hypothetical protein
VNLQGFLNRAIQLVTQAYDFFEVHVLGLPPYRDLWRTTSGNPCVFCRAMEQISIDVVIPPGRHFPAPRPELLAYLSRLDLAYVENPPAHENCQCERVTVLAG